MANLMVLTNIERMTEAGLPFDNVNAARWVHRQRHKNGLADAFVSIGNRVYIDADKFHELVRKNSQ